MPSTWSDLKFELLAEGATNWGTNTNANIGNAIEQAIGGKANVTISSASQSLTLTDTTALQDARALYLNLTGTPGGAATLNVPAVEKPYIVYNNTTGGFAVTVKVSGQTGVSVPNGKVMVLYDNGTDVVDAITHLSSLTLGAALPVASGGTGITSFGTGVATALGQNVTGSGGMVLATSPTLTTPALGTPSSATLTNATGLPLSTGVTGTLPVANGGTGTTTSTGSGSVVLSTSPTFVTPVLGTPTSGTLTNATGLPLSTGVTGTLPVANGGTGQTTYTNGQLLIGNASNTLTKATLTAGSNVTITNGDGAITIAAGSSLTGITNSGSPYTTALGTNAADSITSGQYNTAVGLNALTTQSVNSFCTAVGANALYNNTGDAGVAVGYDALYTNSTGAYNTAVGYQALRANSTASYQTAVGYRALTNATGASNTAVGYSAASNITTGQRNTAFGSYALFSASAASSYNIGIGYSALRFVSGNYNIGIGNGAFNDTCSSSFNVAIGHSVFNALTTGENNIGVGLESLYYLSTGNNNIAIGVQSLKNASNSNNTALGDSAGLNVTTGSNNTLLGYNAQPSAATVSNEITLGNSSVITLRCQVTSITSLSDERDKTGISPLKAGLSFVQILKPVAFTWNMRDGGKVGVPDTGFVAQDLVKAQTDAGVTIPGLVYAENPEKLEAAYGKLIPVLVKAIQELTARVEELEARNV